MTDLRTQLRGYFEDINPPFDPAELIQDAEAQPVPVESPPTYWWSGRRWVYAAAASVVIIAIVGVTAWLIGGTTTQTTPVITQPTTATTPPPTFGSTEMTVQSEALIVRGLTGLKVGVPYITKPELAPLIGFVPPEPGWRATDMMPCEAMGTLLLRHQEGRMFVVPTAGITVDDAVALLLRGPYVNPAVTGSPLSDGNGQAIQAQLSPLVADSFTLGPGSRPLPETGQVKWLLPYHTIIEDGLDLGEPDGGPLMPGDQAEIHLVEVDGGILSVALVTDEMSMETFRPRALALAATVSLDGEPGVGCSDNGISRTQ